MKVPLNQAVTCFSPLKDQNFCEIKLQSSTMVSAKTPTMNCFTYSLLKPTLGGCRSLPVNQGMIAVKSVKVN